MLNTDNYKKDIVHKLLVENSILKKSNNESNSLIKNLNKDLEELQE
jgi:hypothetical protein